MLLKELCTFLPKSKIKAGEGLSNGKYPFFTSSDTKRQYLNDYLFDTEAVILGTGGTASCNYCKGKFATSTDNFVLETNSVLKPKYLYYFLRRNNLSILSNGFKGSGLKHISKDYVGKIDISLKTIDHQNRIIKILDDLNYLISNEEKNVKKYNALIKSRFIEMFGDILSNSKGFEVSKIKQYCFVTKLAGFEYSKYIHYSDTGEVVMVKAQNVKGGKLNDKDLSYISKEVSDSLPRSQLRANDIVMTYVGANIGDVAIIDDKHLYHLAPNVAKMHVDNNKFNTTFFAYMLLNMREYIVGNSINTAKGAISMERIRDLNVLVPPIFLQNKFAAFVELIDKLKFNNFA